MRILQVDKFLRRFGGAAGYMLDLANLQRKAGHDVEFFAMAHPDNLPARFESDFPPFVPLEPPPPGLGARLTTAATMLYSARAARGMAAVLDSFRPDIVHMHNIYHQLSPSILRPLAKRRIPVVMTVHDYKPVCPSYRLLDQNGPCTACVEGHVWQAVKRRCKDGSLPASLVLAVESGTHRLTNAYGSIDRLLAPSQFLADLLVQGGLGAERVRQISNFVDAEAIQPRQGCGNGFVSIGRLSSEKGVDTAIRAIGLLPGSRLTVAGDGPVRAELETLAHSVAPGQVRFVGHVGKAEVAALNEGAVAAVLAARWHENMPLSVLETMASAVPMVVSGLGGLPELIEHGVDGLVVPPDDPPALAAAMGQLLADPSAAATMGTAARAKAIANHDPGHHLAHLFDLYEEAAHNRR